MILEDVTDQISFAMGSLPADMEPMKKIVVISKQKIHTYIL